MADELGRLADELLRGEGDPQASLARAEAPAQATVKLYNGA